jgi:hypothetical protein
MSPFISRNQEWRSAFGWFSDAILHIANRGMGNRLLLPLRVRQPRMCIRRVVATQMVIQSHGAAPDLESPFGQSIYVSTCLAYAKRHGPFVMVCSSHDVVPTGYFDWPKPRITKQHPRGGTYLQGLRHPHHAIVDPQLRAVPDCFASRFLHHPRTPPRSPNYRNT